MSKKAVAKVFRSLGIREKNFSERAGEKKKMARRKAATVILEKGRKSVAGFLKQCNAGPGKTIEITLAEKAVGPVTFWSKPRGPGAPLEGPRKAGCAVALKKEQKIRRRQRGESIKNENSRRGDPRGELLNPLEGFQCPREFFSTGERRSLQHIVYTLGDFF